MADTPQVKFQLPTSATGGPTTGLNADQLAVNSFTSSIFNLPPIVVSGGAGADVAEPFGMVPFVGDTSVPGHLTTNVRGIQPFQGERFTYTPQQALSALSELPKEQMIKWKNALYEAGLYDPGFYQGGRKPRDAGLLDEDDRSAFGRLLVNTLAAPKGTTAQGVLEMMKGDNPFSAKNNYGKQKATSSYEKADPATIRKYAQTAAQQLLGRDLDTKTMEGLVNKMLAIQTGAAEAGAQADVATQNAGQGGVVAHQAVDIGSRTGEAVEASAPAEAAAKKVANGYDVFMKMIMGGQ